MEILIKKAIEKGFVAKEDLEEPDNDETDNFDHPTNQAWLSSSIKEIEEGKVVEMTIEELEGYANS
jgi:hypothetical protein